MAAEFGHVGVVELLIASGAEVDLAAYDGSTPLLMAARNGYVTVVAALVHAKADANKARQDGTTPLTAAVKHGRTEVVKMLVARGGVGRAKLKELIGIAHTRRRWSLASLLATAAAKT